MKNKFSISWRKSIQKRKQRKYRFNAPIHIKKKFLSVNLAKILRKKYGFRNITLRKGDKVMVMRGKFTKHVGEVIRINVKRTKVFVEGVENIKKDGTKIFYPLQPSNLQLTELNLGDKLRKKIIERKTKNVEKAP